MGYIAVLFGLSAFSLALINLLLKRIKGAPVVSTALIVNYLSGVKLYNQTTRAGGSPMDGPDEPPRVAIRRRMIRAMVEIAAGEYERWYILAHSLGTVVAWNGLMEIQEALPNYLAADQWADLQPPLRGTRAAALDDIHMMPNRPVWLDQRDIVDRRVLFKKFRGILTCGSPLERFCALWSNAVAINSDESVFPQGAEWINVYDPTDPVGTWIRDFNPEQKPIGGSAC